MKMSEATGKKKKFRMRIKEKTGEFRIFFWERPGLVLGRIKARDKIQIEDAF